MLVEASNWISQQWGPKSASYALMSVDMDDNDDESASLPSQDKATQIQKRSWIPNCALAVSIMAFVGSALFYIYISRQLVTDARCMEHMYAYSRASNHSPSTPISRFDYLLGTNQHPQVPQTKPSSMNGLNFHMTFLPYTTANPLRN
jgi:hypothetical protein